MIEKPVAVLGGGNGAQTMAADLTLAGHVVHLYETPKFAANPRFAPVLDSKVVELTGIGRTGKARIARVTTDMREALEDVEWINVAIPATGHEVFFEELIPHLRDGQTVVVWAGDYGSLRLAHMMKEKGVTKKVTIAEGNTLPYGTRLEGAGRANLLLLAPRVLLAALPGTRSAELVEKLKPVYPCLEPCENVLVAGFCNPNPIVHPPGSLLNVGRIQYSGGEFWMYREGITEAVARVIRSVFDEVEAVAKGLGMSVLQYEDRDFKTTATIMGVAFQGPFDTIGVIASIAGPHTIQDRYITEDLPFGLVPVSQLGDKLGIDTPLIDGIVSIGSVVCRENYWKTGRTLKRLGLDALSPCEIARYVNGR
ncbi:MAG: NAD/NADP octopine/nopaline dehydrogenase family protein [Bacillota bacterium]|nr:NAD/NADP octopine/nopaline dehydrogenase family protein [Bacillota bacterium]